MQILLLADKLLLFGWCPCYGVKRSSIAFLFTAICGNNMLRIFLHDDFVSIHAIESKKDSQRQSKDKEGKKEDQQEQPSLMVKKSLDDSVDCLPVLKCFDVEHGRE